MKATSTATSSTNYTRTRKVSFARIIMIVCLFIIGMGATNSCAQSYCIPPQSVNYPSGYYISNVTITGGVTNFTNTTGAETASYGDYSSSKVASQFQNYPITISASSAPVIEKGMNYQVYVDYNDNGVFTDPGESVLQLGKDYGPGTLTGMFTIPVNAPVGTHRMRVKAESFSFSPIFDPCNQLQSGETEDYGLTVLSGCSQPTIQATATSISYNASFDTVRLNWTRGNGTGGVLVVGRMTSTTQAFPKGGVSYTANTIFSSGSEVGDGNFVVYNGTGTSVAITGLAEDVSYTFTCYEYNNPGICYKVPGSELPVIVPSNSCIPPASVWYPGSHTYYINNVQTTDGITNFTNATSYEENSYGDYSSAKIVSQARNFPVTITTSGTVGMAYKVYVDYNDNRDFDDPGEMVLQMSTFFSTPLSGSFTIPASAPSGNHRMRIRAERNDINTYPYVFYPAGPCNKLQYGETEDYTLTVPPPCTQPTTQATIGNYTNLLSGTSATVNWTRGNGTGGVLVVGRLTSAVAADPLERLSYTANSVFGSGTQIGTGNFVVYNGTGTSVNVTGLSAAVSYTFTCYDYNNTSTCFKTPGSGSAVITGGYCIPVPSVSNEKEYITNVNTTGGATNFTNPTGREPGSYGFYANTQIASQSQSRSITINVAQSTFSSTLKMAYNVYVDYNDNGVFTDPGELVLQMQSSSSATVSGSFGISADAPIGTHRMRIRGDDISAGYPTDPCSQLQYGETEDYGLTVTPGCTSPTTQATIGSYTNNTGDKMTVNWTRGNGTGGVLVVGRLTSAALTDPNGGDSYTANTIFGSGTDIGQGNFVVYNGTGTSVDVTGLAPGLNYTFTCYEYNVASTCYTTPGSGLAVNSIGYCTPPQSVNYGSGNFIENVITTGGLTNFTNATNTETASYGDYSSSKIASQVQNFPITITATAEGGMNYNVYVDYNDNQIFTDPGELVLQMKYPLTATLSGSFTIPATAPIGTHKMRIRGESYNSGYPTDPCSQLQFGETEDYGLTVVPPCTQPTGQATIESYTNNTSGDKMTVNWTRGNGTGGVLVVGRLTSAAPTDPLSGVSYTANSIFGSGTEIGNGNFVVYNGTGTSVDVSGLSQATGYTFTCYEYNNTRTCYSIPGSASAVTSFIMPMAYSSSNTFQLNTGAMLDPASVNNQIIQVQVVTTGGTSPFDMTSMSFSTNGSANASTDIANAKVYYTGTSSVFATTTQFGSTFDHPNGNFTVNGNQSLSGGTNYFWVVYDLTATPVSGDAIDAGCSQLVMSGTGGTQTPATTSPAGNALVNLAYCVPPQSVNYQSGKLLIGNFSTSGGITNFSNQPGAYYSNDYANYSTTNIASQVQNLPITIQLYCESFYALYDGVGFVVYVDYNDNGVFTDPGEQVTSLVSFQDGFLSMAFTIPANAPPGTHRMRIRADVQAPIHDDCGQLYNGETNDYGLTVIAGCTSPTITSDVSSPSPVNAGETAPDLSVTATGSGTLNYQWYSNVSNSYLDGIAITNETTATYTPDVSTAGTSYYYVIVSGDCGTKTSSVATVTVNAAEIPAVAGTISGAASVCAPTNNTTLTLNGYTGTIQWQSSTDNISFDNIVDATAAIYTASNLTATTWYRAVVTSGSTSETSLAVVTTITPSASAGTVTAGTSPQCIGSTTTYTVSGAVLSGGTGTWSSDNEAVAKVDQSTGLVTAVGGGTCNIIYTVTGGCNGTPTASQPYMVISGIDASASSNPVALGSSAILSATISPAISGVTVSFNVDPGTGVITTYTAVTNSLGVATTTPVSELTVNLYKVVATAASGCDTSDAAYLAVYDPNSSFITGGGWITSPVGALVAQPSLTGKANFGFIAKYKKGNNQVDGNTEFQFQDGDFNFKSSALDPGTLVISGSKGTYRGEGTVNGTGDYGFMVSAVDGQITGGGGTDLFRIKIWDRSNGNTVVYDNNMYKDENGVPTTILGGGSIVIHYANNKKTRVMNTGSNVEIANSHANELTGTGKLSVTVMPNPASYYFTLGLKSLSKEKVKLTVTDIVGRVMEQTTDIPANNTIQLGDHYHPGVYIAQFLQGNDKITLRLIKEGK